MTAEEFASEKHLQDLMVKAIEEDRLADLVVDSAKLRELADESGEAYFPVLAIDHLSRASSIRQGALALESLQHLELLVGDRNVSLTRGETLRPDIVCYNAATESLVLFELKKEGQTGRQALTELLAYEQEIKNQLPFLGSCDVNFVLVSPEWTTLMDHAAVSAATWSGKRILCLEAGLTDDRLTLRTRLPTAWKVTGSVLFPPESVSAVTLSLYGAEDQGGEIDHRLVTALSIMAREGDRSGSSGFAVLWRDHWAGSQARYAITLCGVSPFAFYAACRQSGRIGDRDGALVSALDRIVQQADPSGHTDGLMKVAISANTLLNDFCIPQLEGFTYWQEWKESVRTRAEPLRCDFWGVLGDHARRVILNPTVRSHGRQLIGKGADWQDPWIAIPLVDEFFGKRILAGGNVDSSSSFRLGQLLGLDGAARQAIQGRNLPPGHRLHCFFKWNSIELAAALDEVALLASSAHNVALPASTLKFSYDPHHDADEDTRHLVEWLIQDFLQGEHFHVGLFLAGMVSPVVFGAGPFKPLHDIPAEALNPAKVTLWKLMREAQALDPLGAEPAALLQYLKDLLGVPGSALAGDIDFDAIEPAEMAASWSVALQLADEIVWPVHHKHADVAATTVDWDYFKQFVEETRKQGDLAIGVVLGADGMIGTGNVFREIPNVLRPCEPEEVYFLDASNGLGVVTIRTWESLQQATSLSRLNLASEELEHGGT